MAGTSKLLPGHNHPGRVAVCEDLPCVFLGAAQSDLPVPPDERELEGVARPLVIIDDDHSPFDHRPASFPVLFAVIAHRKWSWMLRTLSRHRESFGGGIAVGPGCGAEARAARTSG